MFPHFPKLHFCHEPWNIHIESISPRFKHFNFDHHSLEHGNSGFWMNADYGKRCGSFVSVPFLKQLLENGGLAGEEQGVCRYSPRKLLTLSNFQDHVAHSFLQHQISSHLWMLSDLHLFHCVRKKIKEL